MLGPLYYDGKAVRLVQAFFDGCAGTLEQHLGQIEAVQDAEYSLVCSAEREKERSPPFITVASASRYEMTQECSSGYMRTRNLSDLVSISDKRWKVEYDLLSSGFAGESQASS